jgi:hypothetical protein
MAIQAKGAMASSIVEKWGLAVAERGFAQLPNYLMQINQFLDPENRLGAVELMILFQLVATWWKKDEMPFPSMKTLALRGGVSERQIQRTIKRLQQLGLIERVRRGEGLMTSNAYNLMPLVDTLQKISKLFPNDRPRRLLRRLRAPNLIRPAGRLVVKKD